MCQPEDKLKIEYPEICSNFRHYSSLRFGILTVFIAVLTINAFPFFTPETDLSVFHQICLIVIGIITTLIFWAYQETAAKHLEYYGDKAKELEEKLGYSNIGARPQPKPILKMKTATRLLYIVIIVFWLAILIKEVILVQLNSVELTSVLFNMVTFLYLLPVKTLPIWIVIPLFQLF